MDNQLQTVMEKPEVKVLLEMMKLSNMEAYRHSISVASIVYCMLEHTDCFKEEKEDIIIGALLHDIGKIFVPFNLTQFPSTLSQYEYNIVKIHALLSYEIVYPVFSRTVQNICLYHHERPDGSGYMSNIVLKDIPREALLVQVADIYDALVSERSYKKKYEPHEAILQMRDEAFKLKLDDEYLLLLETVLNQTEKERE